MKRISLFQKNRSTHFSNHPEDDSFVAEELESRVLFSAAPPAPVEAPVEEVADATEKTGNEAGNFESIEGFVQDSTPDLPELNEILEELDEVSLINLDNLTEEEIATLRDSNISLANLAPATGSTSDEDQPESTTLGLDLIENQLSDVAAVSEVTGIVLPATQDTGAVVPNQVAADESEELTLEKLLEVGEAAKQRWIETGLTVEQIAALDNIEYRIDDLAPTRVGVTEGNVITIDADAAERGWFVDKTPLEDEEFSQTGATTFVANQGTEAAQDIDLVTVVMHEQGHILGLLDESSFDQEEALMYAYISEGQRRVAGRGQAEGSVAGSLEGPLYMSTEVFRIDFDSNNANYTVSDQAVNGSTNYAGVFGAGDISETFTNTDGNFFAAHDTDATSAGSVVSLTTSSIDTSLFTNLQLKFDVAEGDDGGNQDWDANSSVRLQYSIDGGSSFIDAIAIEASGGTNTEPALDTNFDGTGDGTAVTNTFATFTSTILPDSASLVLRVIVENLDAGDEDVAVDNIVLLGDSTGGSDTTAPTVSSIARQAPTASTIGSGTASVTFRTSFSEDVANVTSDDFTATNGTVSGISTVDAATYDVTVSVTGGNGDVVSLALAGGQDIDDLAGNDLTNTTPGTEESYTVDTQGPSLSTSSPSDDASDVSPSQPITLTFNEAVQAGSGNITIKDLDTPSNTVIPIGDSQIEFTGNTVTITPNASLNTSTNYAVQIDATAIEDLAGNPFAGISSDTTLNFTTRAPLGPDLFISEYVEGSSNNKALEFYNPTGATLDLTLYTLERYNNGGTTSPDIVNLGDIQATLDSGRTLVIGNNSGDQAILDARDNSDGTGNSATFFNGDDALLLKKNGIVIDQFGLVGEDPGTNWSDGTRATSEQTLRRKDGTTQGNPDGFSTGDISNLTNEWDSFAQNTFDGLGEFGPDIAAPAPTTLVPADNATNIAVDSNLVITFDEDVQLGTGNITIFAVSGDVQFEQIDVTNGSLVTVSGAEVTINPTGTLANDTEYYVQIDATAIDDLNGNSYAGIGDNTTWTFTTAPAVDSTPPSIDTLSPADDATGVAVDSNLVITFSEDVAIGSGNITILTVSGDTQFEQIDVTNSSLVTVAGNQVTINPAGTLANDTEYYVQIDGTAFDDLSGNSFAGISDNSTWTFTTEMAVATFVRINEIDADTPGSDTAEFIELYDGGVGNTALDGLIVVLFNGSDDRSYTTSAGGAIDLAGFSTDADGFFLIGSTGSGAPIEISPGSSGWLQNGADAVALYADSASNFPNDTAVTATNLIDAIVYDTNDGDDSGLIDVLTPGQAQINEDANGDRENESISRSPDGGTAFDTPSYQAQLATPGVTNVFDTGPNFTIASDISVLEDGEDNGDSLSYTFEDHLTGFSDSDGDTLVSYTVVSVTDASLFTAGPAINLDGDLTFTLAADANGFADVIVRATDSGSGVSPNENTTEKTFRIDVASVPDDPTFNLGGDMSDDDDRDDPFAQQSFQALVDRVFPGITAIIIKTLPPATDGILSFAAGSNVSVNDEIQADDIGNLIFTPDTSAGSTWKGSLSFEYTVRNGDGSEGSTLVFRTSSAVEANLSQGASVDVGQDTGDVRIPGFGRVDSGDIDRSSLFFELSSTKPGLFSQTPTLALDGTLQFTPAQGAFGTSVVTVDLTDGIRSYERQSFLIRVNAFSPNPGVGVGGLFSTSDFTGSFPSLTQSLVFDLLNRGTDNNSRVFENSRVTLAFFSDSVPGNGDDALRAFLGNAPNADLGTILIFNDLSEFQQTLKGIVEGQSSLDFRVLDLSQFIGGNPEEKAVHQAREKTFQDDVSESSDDIDDEAAPKGDPIEASDGAENNQDGRPENDLLESRLDLVER